MPNIPIPRERGIFCNRTLNLRSLEAIGYDMDYTLIHYHVEAWEGVAYEHIRQRLLARGWPVSELRFDPDLIIRGIVVDRELGNLIKINRYGYVKRVSHGLHQLDFEEMRSIYHRTMVDLGDSRYHFLNTLFSLSEGCIYAQLVDLMDQGLLPEVMGYNELWRSVRKTLDLAHVEGQLKEEIMSNPEQYVDLDPAVPMTLLDQKESGKKLLLITNSEWPYTKFMMEYAFDPFMPEGMSWQDLFDMVIVSSRKPKFFEEDAPIFKIINQEGMLEPCVNPTPDHRLYLGGNASHVEQFLGMSGSKILYVGDHIYSDVNASKSQLRWRTALVLRELEKEIEVFGQAEQRQRQIEALMGDKEEIEHCMSHTRLALQRLQNGRPPTEQESGTEEELKQQLLQLRDKWKEIDSQIVPLVIAESRNFNSSWGYLLWDGIDKTHLTHQIQKYADLYTSRVSNFYEYTPFCYFRAPKGSTPHDPVNPIPQNTSRRFLDDLSK